MDFLKRQAPAPSRSNPLSRTINPDVVEKFLREKTHMNITGLKVHPLGFGVSLEVVVYEDKPLNRTRVLQSAVVPLANVLGEMIDSPVDAKVSLDLDNPMFDPTEGVTIYEILLKANPPGDSARRVASKVMLLGLIGH